MQNNQAIPFNKENFKQIFSLKFLLVITISVPSAMVADYFNLPLAWFLGPMLATSIGALVGLKIIIPRIILSSILVLLGLYIGCLLYTSPSPRDLVISRIPSSA